MATSFVQTKCTQIDGNNIRLIQLSPGNDQSHRHAFFELVYVLRGSATHHYGQKEVRLRSGDYFIIDIGSIHCYQDVEDFEIINCLFLPEYIDRALADCPSLSALLSNQMLRFGVPMHLNAADRILHDTDGSIGSLIRLMKQEYQNRHTGYMELLRCYLTQVLVHAVRTCDAAERRRKFHGATTLIVEYLQQHYAEPLSLEKLKYLVGYSAPYLSSMFHKDTGISLQTYQQKLRVEEACRLMAQTRNSLNDIAQAVGYTDMAHFSKVFQRHKQISPKDFRKSICNV